MGFQGLRRGESLKGGMSVRKFKWVLPQVSTDNLQMAPWRLTCFCRYHEKDETAQFVSIIHQF